jgi:hypothetical protein
MRGKYAVTAVLAAFVIVALAMVGRDAVKPADDAAPPVALAATVPIVQAPELVEEMAVVESAPAEKTPVVAVPPVTSVAPPVVAAKADPPKPRAVPAPRTPTRRIVATYFHGSVRCATCRKIEAYAREAIEEGFGSEVAAGRVEFRAVNVEEPQNRHFIDDYQLMTRSVVVTQEVDGAVAQWTRLDKVWTYVGHRPSYLGYVQDVVRGYLEVQ